MQDRQKRLKQRKQRQASASKYPQNCKIIHVGKDPRIPHSKQSKPKKFCPGSLFSLTGILHPRLFLSHHLLYIFRSSTSKTNSFNLANKEQVAHCQLKDWGCTWFCLLLPAYHTIQSKEQEIHVLPDQKPAQRPWSKWTLLGNAEVSFNIRNKTSNTVRSCNTVTFYYLFLLPKNKQASKKPENKTLNKKKRKKSPPQPNQTKKNKPQNHKQLSWPKNLHIPHRKFPIPELQITHKHMPKKGHFRRCICYDWTHSRECQSKTQLPYSHRLTAGISKYLELLF